MTEQETPTITDWREVNVYPPTIEDVQAMIAWCKSSSDEFDYNLPVDEEYDMRFWDGDVVSFYFINEVDAIHFKLIGLDTILINESKRVAIMRLAEQGSRQRINICASVLH